MRFLEKTINKVKLLIFIHSLGAGGAERVTAHLVNFWAERGWDITILTMVKSEVDAYIIDSRVKRISLGLDAQSSSLWGGIKDNILRIKSLRRVINKVQPDTVLSMMSNANVLLALASIGNKRFRTVGSERTHPPCLPLGKAWELLRKFTYCYLDAVVALTDKSALWLKENTNPRKVVVIPNAAVWPIPVNQPILDPSKWIDKERCIIGVGRLSPEKGFDILIEIFKDLRCEFPNWSLLILGEGGERQKLESLISDNDLTSCVKLPGRAGNIGEWYKEASVYVMTSKFEGFPNTLVEAMASGLPAISFDCDTGPADIIKNGVNGFLILPGNVLAMREAIRRLMRDEQLRCEMGQKAISVRAKFSHEAIMQKWGAILCDGSR